MGALNPQFHRHRLSEAPHRTAGDAPRSSPRLTPGPQRAHWGSELLSPPERGTQGPRGTAGHRPVPARAASVAPSGMLGICPALRASAPGGTSPFHPQLSFLDQTQASSPGLGRGKSKVAAHTSGPLRGHLGEGEDSVVGRRTQEKATRSLASEPPDRLRGESQLMVRLESSVGRTALCSCAWGRRGWDCPGPGRRVEGDKTQDTGPAGGPRCPETRRPGGVCEFPPPRLLGPHGPRPQVTAVQTRRAGGRQQGHSGVMVSQRAQRGARGGKYVCP